MNRLDLIGPECPGDVVDRLLCHNAQTERAATAVTLPWRAAWVVHNHALFPFAGRWCRGRNQRAFGYH